MLLKSIKIMVLCALPFMLMAEELSDEPMEGDFIEYDFPECTSEQDKIEGCVKRSYHENGRPWYETLYQNGKKQGSRGYYENGNLETEFSYKNGARDGITKVYMFNGKLLIAITYQEGKALSGICGNDKVLSDEQLQSVAIYYPLPQKRIAQLCGMKLEVD